MTWSPLRHSLKTYGPLETVGAVFSGALSIASAWPGATYLPKMCVGIGPALEPNALTSAGQKTLANFTLNFLGSAASIFTPEIVVAVPSTNAFQPSMSWKLLLRTVSFDIATALSAVR